MATKTMLFGKAALTAIRLTDGRRANIPAGRAVPENIDQRDAARLLDEGFLVEVEVVEQIAVVDPDDLEPEGPNPPATRGAVPAGLTFDDVTAAAATEAARAAGEPDPGTVVDVETDPFTDEELDTAGKANVDEALDQVGDNPVKAQQLLDAENAKEKPRSTLVAGLQDVLDAAAAGADDSEDDES